MVLTVGALQESDIDEAFALSAREGWNQTVADWARLTRIEPSGCFAARVGGRLAGTATVITYGRALAWIGMVVVHADFRRRGIGAALMRRALDYARDRDVPVVKLDATPAGRFLYESLGFAAETEFERWEGWARPVDGSGPRATSDAPAPISALDATAYGVDRADVLGALAGESLGSPLVAWSDGEPAGYALARCGREATYLGPIVATAPGAAIELLQGMIERFSDANVCLDRHADGFLPAAALETRGLARRRTLLRMRLGPGDSRGTPPSVCASAGPELG